MTLLYMKSQYVLAVEVVTAPAFAGGEVGAAKMLAIPAIVVKTVGPTETRTFEEVVEAVVAILAVIMAVTV
jgi:hypothetical protein